jgi:dextranase
MSDVKITAAYPTRAFFRPGEPIGIHVQLSASPPIPLELHVDVVSLGGTVVQAHSTLAEKQGTITAPLPTLSGVGYGARVELRDPRTGTTLDRCTTSLDVQQSWVDAPRYGVLCEFSPGEDYTQRSEQLLQRHINVVQFYDWMYRHYQYLPPQDTFTDVLGRTLALSSTQSAIAAVHARGMAAIAYGSVYGAEAEYALQHPAELVYDAQGQPLSLGKVFYLQDLRPGPWRDRILGEYRSAVHDLEFNGIHADQYGIEDDAFDAQQAPVPWGSAFAGIIAAAQHAVEDAGGTGIIFNFVNNWPIDAASAAPQLCTYIEVWPPHITLNDLHSLIRGAKRLAPDRQVILAAYMSCAAGLPDAAEGTTLLATATIAASGGFHLLSVEGTGILADAYYPKFVRPGAHFTRHLLEMQDFTVRYGAYLYDRSLSYGTGVRLSSAHPWAIHRRGSAFDTLSLVNAKAGDLWDAARTRPSTRKNVRVTMPFDGKPQRVYLASPGAGADAVSVPFDHSNGTIRFTVPSVDIWTLAIITRESST